MLLSADGNRESKKDSIPTGAPFRHTHDNIAELQY